MDFICPYRCAYRTNTWHCGSSGGYKTCQYRQLHSEQTNDEPSIHELLEIAKRGGYDAKLDVADGTVVFTPRTQTNADHIRAMTDAELAEWIAHPKICYCQHDICDGETDCAECALDWLKQEAQCTSE